MNTKQNFIKVALFFSLITNAQVGIGTTNPTADLEIVTNTNTSASGAFKITNSSSTKIMEVKDDGEVDLSQSNNSLVLPNVDLTTTPLADVKVGSIIFDTAQNKLQVRKSGSDDNTTTDDYWDDVDGTASGLKVIYTGSGSTQISAFGRNNSFAGFDAIPANHGGTACPSGIPTVKVGGQTLADISTLTATFTPSGILSLNGDKSLAINNSTALGANGTTVVTATFNESESSLTTILQFLVYDRNFKFENIAGISGNRIIPSLLASKLDQYDLFLMGAGSAGRTSPDQSGGGGAFAQITINKPVNKTLTSSGLDRFAYNAPKESSKGVLNEKGASASVTFLGASAFSLTANGGGVGTTGPTFDPRPGGNIQVTGTPPSYSANFGLNGTAGSTNSGANSGGIGFENSLGAWNAGTGGTVNNLDTNSNFGGGGRADSNLLAGDQSGIGARGYVRLAYSCAAR